MIRLAAIAIESLEKIGVKDPHNHMMIIKQNVSVSPQQRTQFAAVANLMVKRSPFTEKETMLLTEKASEQGFEVLYDPYNPKDNIYNDLIRSNDRKKFYEDYSLDISPSSDDRPFFFYTIKLKDTANFLKLF